MTRALLILQSIGAVAALAGLAFWPPRTGPMMIVALDGAPGRALAVALAADARLLGRGPLPGSLLVVGERGAIAARAAGQPILVLAAPAAGCGGLEPRKSVA